MNAENQNQNYCRTNYIRDTVSKIDKLQKEVVSNSLNHCISCQTALTSNNTIPVRFYTCCGNPVVGNIGPVFRLTETEFFRIESIRCNRYVTLRLLTIENDTLVATDYTMILDLECVGSIQCFEAITVEVCTNCCSIQASLEQQE